MIQQMLYPRQVVLITAASQDKANVTSVEWITPVSEKPPIVAFSLANSSLTLDLVCSSMEFVVAIPDEKLKDAVILCGSTSGKYIDKFAEAGLTQVKAKKVSAPLILQAVANFECKVLSYRSEGDHTLVIGEVLETHLNENGKPGPLIFSYGKKKLFALQKESLPEA
jgi:flavin reductase (DIM6/NTAB) family NADH-FMN oxidoreductase RutF